MLNKRLFTLILIAFSVILFSVAYFLYKDSKIIVRTVTYKPTIMEEPLQNPFMGFAARANYKNYEYPFSLVFNYVTWDELEPIKGSYDFKTFENENNFDYWRLNGKKIIFRLVLDYPQKETHKDIPDWLYDEIHGDGTWYSTSLGKGFSPNYYNPVLIKYHSQLISKIAERYNNDPVIAFIELGSLGHWGEFHTSTIITGKDIPFPDEKIANQYIQPYVNGFKNKFLLIRRPMPIAVNNGMGLYNDSFGNKRQTEDWFIDWFTKGYTWWQTGEYFPGMPNFWKYAPCGGETSTPFDAVLEKDIIEDTISDIMGTHVSYWKTLNFKYNTSNPNFPQIKRVLTNIGYRFILSSISYNNIVLKGENIHFDMEWANIGVAPFYYNWPIQISLSNNKGDTVLKKLLLDEDISKWMPGNTKVSADMSIPESLENGEYTVNVSIIDPSTGLPGIKLAIEGIKQDGQYEVGSITIDE